MKRFDRWMERASAQRRGGVLVLALMAVMSVTALAACFLQLTAASTRRQAASLDGKRSFYMAEAGLAEGYTALGTGRTGNVGTPVQPARLGDGVFWVEATPDPVEAAVRLDCTALVGSGRTTLSIVAEPRTLSIGALGIFSTAAVEMHPGTLVDGWDSSAGSYASQVVPFTPGVGGASAIPAHAPGVARVGSNDDVHISGAGVGSHVFGHVEYGTAGGYSDSGEVLVEGNVEARTEDVLLPAVQVPALPLLPSLTVDSPTPVLINGVDAGYEEVTVAHHSELIVRGPVDLVVGDVLLESSARLTLDSTTGPINLYVNDTLTVDTGASIVTPNEDPTALTIQVASVGGTKVSLDTDSDLYGTLYAPSTGIWMSKNFELFGAVVANSLRLSKGARLHVDEALAKSLGVDSLPLMLSWRIVENPLTVARDRRGISQVLELDASQLPVPRDAHRDVWLDLDYVDTAGHSRTYTGWESGFDWEGVSQVKQLSSYTDDPNSSGALVF